MIERATAGTTAIPLESFLKLLRERYPGLCPRQDECEPAGALFARLQESAVRRHERASIGPISLTDRILPARFAARLGVGEQIAMDRRREFDGELDRPSSASGPSLSFDMAISSFLRCEHQIAIDDHAHREARTDGERRLDIQIRSTICWPVWRMLFDAPMRIACARLFRCAVPASAPTLRTVESSAALNSVPQ